MRQSRIMFCLVAVLLVVWTTMRFGVSPVQAERVSNIRNTKHNLSASGTGTVHAASTQSNAAVDATQVCIFCHTPHAANQVDQAGVPLARAPLWNRKVPSGATYTRYTSISLDAETIADGYSAQPGGSSKLCLSCHDGTLAIGSVGVMTGKQNISIDMAGGTTTMPVGSYGATSGFTRNLGTDLSNDHPISITYNSALVTADGELRTMDGSQRVSISSPPNTRTNYAVGIPNSPAGTRPLLPLQVTSAGGNGQIQCATCHDPHVSDPSADHNIKFLRANRFQVVTPNGANFNATNDIICLACHDKGGAAWNNSVHASDATATPAYNSTAVAVREFPSRGTGFKVWEAACLNCHDTHSVQGARRLLREGTDSTSSPKAGGSSAIEETCFQCHRKFNDAGQVLSLTSQTVPDIMSDFGLSGASTYHMPIRSTEQCAGSEKHDIGDSSTGVARNLKGKDFFEAPSRLGGTGAGSCDSGSTRHVECTDCHNPHRAIKNSLYNGGGVGTQATHQHTSGIAHSNTASGALKGTYGVEPNYGVTTFGSLPSSYTALCGIEGGTNNACSLPVTKEYQICLKCHSDYAYSDTGGYNAPGRPPLATTGTADTTRPTTKAPYNQWVAGDKYTNQAMEFQAPAGDTSEYLGGGSQANCFDTGPDVTCNHRSWHPVIASTGRTATIRGWANNSKVDISNNWYAPFNTAGSVGNQTMYCTDCHGSDTGAEGKSSPATGKAWGPHGSTNPFILKGSWNTSTGVGQETNGLCFKCHQSSIYAPSGGGGTTGFWISSRSQNGSGKDGHKIHNSTGNTSGKIRCNWCHVAVPHGWKNKALLVNLNDVGPEVGLAAGTEKTGPYTQGPYYRRAMLKVYKFSTSGNWGDQDCGSKTGPATGRDGWMKQSNGCANPPVN